MLAALALAAGVAPAPSFATSVADPFASCRVTLAARPADYESAYCFYETSLTGRLWEAATAALDALIEEHPENHWLSLTLGHVYRGRDAARAEALYRRAAEGFRAAHLDEGEVLAHVSLRDLLFPLGRAAEAAHEIDTVAAIAARSREPLVKARAWTAQAMQLQDTGGDLGWAYGLLERARAVVFPAGPYRLKRTLLSALGSVAFRMGRLDEAIATFETLDALAAAAGDVRLRANAQYNIVNARVMKETLLPTRGALPRVAALAERSLETAAAAQSDVLEGRAHRLLAELNEAVGARTEGRAHAKRCAVLAAKLRRPHDEAVCAWVEASLSGPGSPARAAAERRADEATARARSPRTEAFSAGRRMRLAWETDPGPAALDAGLDALRSIERLRDLQDGESSAAQLFSAWTLDYYWLSGRLLERARQGDVARAFAIDERMRARALLDRTGGAGEFVGLHDVQAVLGDDEALLSFQVGLWKTFDNQFGGGAWLVAVTANGYAVFPLPDRAQLAAQVPVYNGLIARGDGLDTSAGSRLYELLLAPALGWLPPSVTRLILVPDDALHHLPFDALRATPGAPPLALRYELVTAPSATLWQRRRLTGTRRRSGRVLALADPAPPDDPAAAATPVERRRLGRLPFARREVAALARDLGDADVLTGERASEHAVKSRDLRDYALLHFAAHAVSDGARPERSAVLLAADASDDGLLQAREIEGLDLGGRVIVLSACETAGGVVQSGEGVLSLARAFLAAGADAVIGTRWPIRDADAAWLFSVFYRHLADGQSLAAALRLAKGDAIAAGRPVSVWAGLVLIGRGELTLEPVEGPAAAHTLAGAGAVVGLSVVVAWRKRRGRVVPRGSKND